MPIEVIFECILLENEPLAVGIMKAYINQRSDLRLVANAYQLREFRDDLMKFPVSIVFLDIIVPDGGSDGFHFGLIPDHISIVIASGLDPKEYRPHFHERNVFELPKPVSLEMFNQCMDQVICQRIKSGLT